LELVNRFKSEFLANMSHELRTPLNSILVLSQLLVENAKGNLAQKQVEYARTIHSSGSDLMTLINEILDLSKVESGKLEINVDKLYFSNFREDIEKTFTPLVLNKGLRLLVDIEQKLPPFMMTDRQRVFQVIKNLISNAIKFTEKGEVELRIYRPSPEIYLNRQGLKANECIAFSVRDTGTGIPKDKFQLIFDAFQQADGTTSRKYGGTGLGLSISKNFSELLGGEIHVASEPGIGSTFIMYLPETYTPPKEPEKPEATSSENKPTQPVVEAKPAEGSKKLETFHTLPANLYDDRDTILKGDRFILVIEDDISFLKVLYDLSHEKGFKCLLATDGESGLYFADYYGPSAIILDVGLPCIDGFEVMTRLKANPHTRHIPVHFITANDKGEEAFKMGAVGYITKPVSTESLQQVFKKLEEVITSASKRILVVDDEEIIRRSLVSLLSGKDVEIKAVASGTEAFELLKTERFDGIVLDLGLDDISGADLLEKIRQEKELANIPVFIYTGKELTQEEESRLSKYADSIIIKGARSPERLLAETTLFLHRIKAVMPLEKQEMLEAVFNRDAVFQNRKVLIVDDDMRNVFALTNVLEDCGLRVIVGRNGREGLELLQKNKDVDLVLLDIMMPEMDGYETMRAIRKDPKYAKLPIIALTAKAMKDDREKCITAGANEYLSKPFDKDKLLSLLRVWLYR
ncbi:MAG TPA: response regulator, partial [Bacteroidales bacterium]|nr:response regulator [Bacteroidales bacterium]